MMHSKTEALSIKTATCMVNSDAIATARGRDSFRRAEDKPDPCMVCVREALPGSTPA